MLRRIKEKILINDPGSTVEPATVGTNRTIPLAYGKITIPTSATITAVKTCATACTQQTSTIVLTTSPVTCECPWEFGIWVHTFKKNSYKIGETFTQKQYYSIFLETTGVDPDTYGPLIVAAIMADPNRTVTVTYTSGTDTLLFTELSCSASNGFKVYSNYGTVVNGVVAHIEGYLTDEHMRQLFPIKQGDFGANPYFPIAGQSYCRIALTATMPIQDVDGPSHYNDIITEYDIYVNTTPANYAAVGGWEDSFDTVFGTTL